VRSLLLIAILVLCPDVTAAPLRAAVAANFREAFEALTAAYATAGGETIEASYAASGMLATQIENGAPFAIFFSADSDRPAHLEAIGRGRSGSRTVYAIGRLVLWTPGHAAPDARWLAESGHRIAIANPTLAPYGRAAVEVLRRLNVPDFERRLVKGTSIAQAAHFVATGAVPGGLLAAAQLQLLGAVADDLWRVPDTLHAPIVQEAIVIEGSQADRAAHFLAFVGSEPAKRMIEAHGYLVPRS